MAEFSSRTLTPRRLSAGAEPPQLGPQLQALFGGSTGPQSTKKAPSQLDTSSGHLLARRGALSAPLGRLFGLSLAAQTAVQWRRMTRKTSCLEARRRQSQAGQLGVKGSEGLRRGEKAAQKPNWAGKQMQSCRAEVWPRKRRDLLPFWGPNLSKFANSESRKFGSWQTHRRPSALCRPGATLSRLHLTFTVQ